MTGIAARRVEPDPVRTLRPWGVRELASARLSGLHPNRAESVHHSTWVFPQHQCWISALRALQNLNRQGYPQQLEVGVMTFAPDHLVKVKLTRRERASVIASAKASETASVPDTGIAAPEPIIAIPAVMDFEIEAREGRAAMTKGGTVGIGDSGRITVIPFARRNQLRLLSRLLNLLEPLTRLPRRLISPEFVSS